MAPPVTPEPGFANPRKQSPKSSPWSQESSDGRIAHTLTACTRCRQRKSRCDTGIPRCEPCERSNSKCVYFDPARNRTIPRTYIVQLRERVRMLEEELANAEKEVSRSPDAEIMVRGAGYIKFGENDESRFLGPSSGITITRLVMEMAKLNTDTKSIKEIVPDITAQEIKDAFTKESQKPTSKIYPMISSVAEPNLPPRELTFRLVDIFMAKAQYMLPTLHEPTFRQQVDEVLNGSTDQCLNFQVRLVIAISMQKISPQYAGLADSYYLAALPYLEAAMTRMDLSTLQCFALIAQYSLLTPTRTSAYWVVGIAAKLCQDLGFTDEATITNSPDGPLSSLEIDMRRRLFWIIMSMEYGLSHSLGRPSFFATTHDHINVKFFEMVDDRFITPNGILPGGKPTMKKCITIHFFKMRLLQSEIRRTLYLKKRDTPVDDQDPWFTNMLNKIDHWVASCPKNDEGSGLSEVWFQGRRNTMIVFLFRPSPQVPEPSFQAAQRCYEASVSNIKIHMDQVANNTVDLTWIFAQAVFMALNTLLWSLSYPGIRQEHPIEEVQGHLQVALDVISVSAERWPGVESALRLYKNLISACLKAYGSDESYVVHSPLNRLSPASTHDVSISPTLSTVSHPTPTNLPTLQPPKSIDQMAPGGTAFVKNIPRPPTLNPQVTYGTGSGLDGSSSAFETPAQPNPAPVQTGPYPPPSSQDFQIPAYNTQQYVTPLNCYSSAPVNTNSPHNPFPSVVPGLQHWDPDFTMATTTSGHLAYSNATADPAFWVGSIGDQYSQYFNQPYPVPPWRERSLSQQEQIELMATLEENLPDVSDFVDATVLYSIP
ncbi:hypothetical protein FQN54_002033 [Arachnomyces sp. PD_36]|nr:hypothetical protein FQN54_002033 [Arachnomyces sp. PD_36]